MFEPKALRQDSAFPQGRPCGQAQKPAFCIVSTLVNGSELPIGCYEAFQFFPQVIHGIQFGTLLGQPEKLESQLGGQLLALDGVVAWCVVQQEPDGAAAVTLAQISQEGLEVFLSLPRASEHQAMSGSGIDRTKEHPLGIATADLDHRRFAAKGPRMPQRREPSQDRCVQDQQHCTGRHPFQAANEAPFFCARLGSLPW
jgi:hypothetical protein